MDAGDRSLTRVSRTRCRIGGAAIAIGLLLSVPDAALAAKRTSLPPDAALAVSVQPHSGEPLSYFDLRARRGRETRAGVLRLANHGDKPIVVKLAPVSALTIDTLGSGYDTSATARNGSARWVHLSDDWVRLRPHGSAVVHVNAAPPRSARSGDYLAGVSVQALGQESTAHAAGRGMEIADLRRYAIGVETRVPGPRHAGLAFTGATVRWSPSGLMFHVRARNTGNVILTGVRGSITIRAHGRHVARMGIGPGTFVTHSSIEIPVLATRERPKPGTEYTVAARLRYSGRRTVTLHRTVRFGHAAAVTAHTYEPKAMPAPGGAATPKWLGPLLGVLGTLLLVGVWRVLVARRRRGGPPAPPPPASAPRPPSPPVDSPPAEALHPAPGAFRPADDYVFRTQLVTTARSSDGAPSLSR